MKWAVLCDFDGTISQLDIGNEIHRSVYPAEYVALQKAYRAKELSLRKLQFAMWENFPLSRAEFRKRASSFGGLRSGFKDFLAHCRERNVLFIVASCGIRDYIEAALESVLTPQERQHIHKIHCNEADFSDSHLVRFITPEADSSDVTLDKGRLARDLRLSYPGIKVLGIGNGTSDQSMVGHVDKLAATDALSRWAQQKSLDYLNFDGFETLTQADLFAE